MAKWTPQDDDVALTLAAIRWYAISIEKLATDLYITEQERYVEVKDVLGKCVKDLRKIRKELRAKAKDKAKATTYTTSLTDQQQQPKKMLFGPTCAPGYVNCFGICMPECDDAEALQE